MRISVHPASPDAPYPIPELPELKVVYTFVQSDILILLR